MITSSTVPHSDFTADTAPFASRAEYPSTIRALIASSVTPGVEEATDSILTPAVLNYLLLLSLSSRTIRSAIFFPTPGADVIAFISE